MSAGGAAWAAACALVGTRFRLHGRDPATGLDCVGLVAAAYRAAGHAAPLPHGYPLRGVEQAAAAGWLAAAGLVPDHTGAQVGDVLLAAMGGGQLHLMIGGADAVVHAHAGLGRVVLMPGALPGWLLGRWRLPPAAGRGEQG